MTSISDAERMGLRWENVLAWAETRRTHSLVARPSSLEECARVVEFGRNYGFTICPRGAGYSYADMILNDGQIILDTSGMNRILSWNEETGHLVAEPGVTFAQILQKVLVSCWTIAACVGSMGVTVAGGVSNNVHGKDSWKVGNFGDHIIELKLLTASGDIVRVNRITDPELFRAVVGGMGLMGVIVEVTLQVHRVPSPFVSVTTTPVRNLRELFETLDQARECSDFAIAWADAFAAGKKLGRGFVTRARWVETDRGVNGNELASSLTVPPRIFGVLPARATWRALRPFYGSTLVRFANAFRYYLSHWEGSGRETLLFTEFNFMHNKIPDLKHVWRPHGLLEFQPIIPRQAGVKAIEDIFQLCQREGIQSLLCGVKAHRSDDFTLSYAGDGYSLGIDVALRGRDRRALKRFARKLYSFVADCGGKAYLAKDELLPRDLFERMYPQYNQFLQTKQRIDPQNIFASDMYRRLLA